MRTGQCCSLFQNAAKCNHTVWFVWYAFHVHIFALKCSTLNANTAELLSSSDFRQLTLYLTNILTFYLAAFYLTSSLTFYLTYIQTVNLAFCLTFSLAFWLAFCMTFYLPIPRYINSDIQSGLPSDICFDIISFLVDILFGIRSRILSAPVLMSYLMFYLACVGFRTCPADDLKLAIGLGLGWATMGLPWSSLRAVSANCSTWARTCCVIRVRCSSQEQQVGRRRRKRGIETLTRQEGKKQSMSNEEKINVKCKYAAYFIMHHVPHQPLHDCGSPSKKYIPSRSANWRFLPKKAKLQQPLVKSANSRWQPLTATLRYECSSSTRTGRLISIFV